MSDVLNQIDVKSLSGLTQDSRAVKDGYLFAALPGTKLDGRDYIGDAVRHGARIILAPSGTHLPEGVKATLVTDERPRQALARIAAAFYKLQPEHIAAVTGTNGKTSTALFTEQIWRALGYKAASLGTLGLRAPGLENIVGVRSGSMTTPDPVALHAELADLAAVGVSHLAIEASSHGLDQYRLDGLRIMAAGFTNLTRDHLDYHKDMDEYRAAKMRLFAEVMQADGTAVLNADVSEFKKFKEVCAKRGLKILSYGLKGDDLRLLKRTPTGQGQDIKLSVMGEEFALSLPLVGEFQVMNVLCALGLVLAMEPQALKDAVAALSELRGAPGRLQGIAGHPKGGAVYIDYAHTPDALENVLKALRPHTKKRLVCVFGCGGDRDKGKRPVMGKIASDLADQVIVTDDNPRGERPEVIRGEIMAAAKGAREIGDRRAAIRQAVADLQAGDVLVIAGKGHERGQIFADRTEPFDDVIEAQKSIENLQTKNPQNE